MKNTKLKEFISCQLFSLPKAKAEGNSLIAFDKSRYFEKKIFCLSRSIIVKRLKWFCHRSSSCLKIFVNLSCVAKRPNLAAEENRNKH